MIRPFTLLAAMLFVLSGAYLFAVKHRSQMLDDQIAQVTQATRLDEQRIRVLQAQWALEADPSRLTQLSAEFTNLQPMKPAQLVTLAALASALPPPGSAVPQPNPENAMPALPVTVASAAAPPLPVVATATRPPVIAAASAPAPPVKLTAAPAADQMASVEALLRTFPAHAPGHRPARVRHEAPLREYAQSRPDEDGGSALAPIAMAPPPPPPLLGAQVMNVRAVSPAPPPPLPADGGSMLGMAQNMGGNAN